MSSNQGGRPRGSKNQPGHAAGGARARAGRPEAKKRKTDTSAPAMRATKSTGNVSKTNTISQSCSSIKVFALFIYLFIN